MAPSRQLRLGAFMRPATIHTGAWRYPGAFPDANFNFAHIKRFAQTLERGKFDLEAIAALPDEAAAAALDGLHGVGPWTAHCYLLFALRRPDVFPAADLALMEAVRHLWRLRARPAPAVLAKRAAAWRPHRAAAARQHQRQPQTPHAPRHQSIPDRLKAKRFGSFGSTPAGGCAQLSGAAPTRERRWPPATVTG